MSILPFRLHARMGNSLANGPSQRAVIWFQGCKQACVGCFNPDTHDPSLGEAWTVEACLDWLEHLEGIEGVTLQGGEPLEQPDALAALICGLKARTTLGIILLTGWTLTELATLPGSISYRTGSPSLPLWLQDVDLLLAGPYVEDLHLGTGLRGSSNKEVLFHSARYGPEDLNGIPDSEVFIGRNGELLLTGIAGKLGEMSENTRGRMEC